MLSNLKIDLIIKISNLIHGLFSSSLIPAEVAASTSGVNELDSVICIIFISAGKNNTLATFFSATYSNIKNLISSISHASGVGKIDTVSVDV